ncbi:xanthine dehydrogenase [Methylosinus sp. Ce-a6]|uniref:xanthine dehydrogenase n=1 Tax=Methylosinus sp. Ce-a6 TaxID=2172005 RepID=UPI0019156BBA|nr:xanthine dehydrogenase [Methylosinus sp. Ce-a6]
MRPRHEFLTPRRKRPLAVILGTNEIASAVAVHMNRIGWACVLSHDPFPPVIRRRMAFHDCLYGERITLEEVAAERADTTMELVEILDYTTKVAVTPMQFHDLVAVRTAHALVDARLQKYRATPDLRHLAKVAVGLGPNFAVGRNCDIAIETKPSQAGLIVREGATEPADHVPNRLGDVGEERFAYSAKQGLWHSAIDIGVLVFKDFVVGHLDGEPVAAPLDGVLRGVARDGLQIPAGVKLLEIDPRGRSAKWTGIDERSALVASAVGRAIRVELAKREATPIDGPFVAH